jgi:hypothetical protein
MDFNRYQLYFKGFMGNGVHSIDKQNKILQKGEGKMYDCVIIGAGLYGAASLTRLKRRGKESIRRCDALWIKY